MPMRARQGRPELAFRSRVLFLMFLGDGAPQIGKHVGEIGPSMLGEHVCGDATKRKCEIRAHCPANARGGTLRTR